VRTDLVDIAIAVIFLVAVVAIWRTGDDDPTWEERWRELSAADRTRISAAARSGSLLASPEEIELAAGFARRDRFNRRRQRRSSYVEAPMFFLVAASTALSLAGMAHNFTGWALSIAGIGTALWIWFGEKAAERHGARSQRPGRRPLAQQARDLGHRRRGPVAQVLPPQPRQSITRFRERLVAFAVPLPRRRVVVEASAVSFDDELLLAPEEVDLVDLASEAKLRVGLGDRQGRFGQQRQ
jgi:hypothetical protein